MERGHPERRGSLESVSCTYPGPPLAHAGLELSRRRGAAALPSLVPRGAATAAAGTRWQRTGLGWNGNVAGVDPSRHHRSPGVGPPHCKRPAGRGEEESTAPDPTTPGTSRPSYLGLAPLGQPRCASPPFGARTRTGGIPSR